ncbi:trichohyalin-like [Patiria miniata]|uniref:Uncharacterized protein n=1 Tax=Patiria miniata TaxID=46514 RepID=A0A913ZR22_PATMI|nr:trichohyalin-like [Patiria miniata]
MPQKTIQDLDAYIKATAVVYDHSNAKLVSRKTKVSRRRKEAFLSVLPYRKPSSQYHSHERRTSSSLNTRKTRSKPATESVINNLKQKLKFSVKTPENANDDAPQRLSFQLDLGTSVQSLKELIEKQIGLEARRQRLYIRRNFQLCDLLTLEENGVNNDEIISLRLSKDDQTCDDVPKDKSIINDEYLKNLSSKIESSWKEVAKHLGYEEADIADIQTTNEGSIEESRNMLRTWWEKTTDRDEAAQKLRRALEVIGLTDLAQNVPATSESRDETVGPEPERRQDAGVDEESKQSGTASTEEGKLKKEQLCNLLTLHDYGIQQDENISLRLCTDGLLGGGLKGKHFADDPFFRDLASKTESCWNKLAKSLGYEEAEIKEIQTTFQNDKERSLQMLLSWWRKQTNREEGFQSLRDALNSIGREELAFMIPSDMRQRMKQEEIVNQEKARTSIQTGGTKEQDKQKGTTSSEGQRPRQEEVGHLVNPNTMGQMEGVKKQNMQKGPTSCGQRPRQKEITEQDKPQIPEQGVFVKEQGKQKRTWQSIEKQRPSKELPQKKQKLEEFEKNVQNVMTSAEEHGTRHGQFQLHPDKSGQEVQMGGAKEQAKQKDTACRPTSSERQGQEAVGYRDEPEQEMKVGRAKTRRKRKMNSISKERRLRQEEIGHLEKAKPSLQEKGTKEQREQKGASTSEEQRLRQEECGYRDKPEPDVTVGRAKKRRKRKRTSTFKAQRSRQEELGHLEKAKPSIQEREAKKQRERKGTLTSEEQRPRREEVSLVEKPKPSVQKRRTEEQSTQKWTSISTGQRLRQEKVGHLEKSKPLVQGREAKEQREQKGTSTSDEQKLRQEECGYRDKPAQEMKVGWAKKRRKRKRSSTSEEQRPSQEKVWYGDKPEQDMKVGQPKTRRKRKSISPSKEQRQSQKELCHLEKPKPSVQDRETKEQRERKGTSTSEKQRLRQEEVGHVEKPKQSVQKRGAEKQSTQKLTSISAGQRLRQEEVGYQDEPEQEMKVGRAKKRKKRKRTLTSEEQRPRLEEVGHLEKPKPSVQERATTSSEVQRWRKVKVGHQDKRQQQVQVGGANKRSDEKETAVPEGKRSREERLAKQDKPQIHEQGELIKKQVKQKRTPSHELPQKKQKLQVFEKNAQKEMTSSKECGLRHGQLDDYRDKPQQVEKVKYHSKQKGYMSLEGQNRRHEEEFCGNQDKTSKKTGITSSEGQRTGQKEVSQRKKPQTEILVAPTKERSTQKGTKSSQAQRPRQDEGGHRDTCKPSVQAAEAKEQSKQKMTTSSEDLKPRQEEVSNQDKPESEVDVEGAQKQSKQKVSTSTERPRPGQEEVAEQEKPQLHEQGVVFQEQGKQKQTKQSNEEHRQIQELQQTKLKMREFEKNAQKGTTSSEVHGPRHGQLESYQDKHQPEIQVGGAKENKTEKKQRKQNEASLSQDQRPRQEEGGHQDTRKPSVQAAEAKEQSKQKMTTSSGDLKPRQEEVSNLDKPESEVDVEGAQKQNKQKVSTSTERPRPGQEEVAEQEKPQLHEQGVVFQEQGKQKQTKQSNEEHRQSQELQQTKLKMREFEKNAQKGTTSSEVHGPRHGQLESYQDKHQPEIQVGRAKEQRKQNEASLSQDQRPKRDEIGHRDDSQPEVQMGGAVGVTDTESRSDTRPDDRAIRKQSEKIATDWEKLALCLKCSKEHIGIIRANHSNDVVRQCFEMLSTWWRKQDNYTEAWRTLEKALIDSGRNDLVRGTSAETGRAQSNPSDAADQCRSELEDRYTTTGSYVQLIPWVDDDMKHIMDIYTELQLEKGDQDDIEGYVNEYGDIFLIQKDRKIDSYSNDSMNSLVWLMQHVAEQTELLEVDYLNAPCDDGIQLSIQSSSLTGKDMVDTLQSFSNRGDLVSLILDGIHGPGGSQKIWPPPLPNRTELCELGLRDFSLQRIDMEDPAEALSQIPSLDDLDISKNLNLSGNAGTYLGSTLTKHDETSEVEFKTLFTAKF